MERFLKNLQYKIFFVLLIPAAGLIYFATTSVYNDYFAYQRSISLKKEIDYTYYTLLLVQNLQKERGLSVLALTKPSYRKKLQVLRAKNSKLVKRFLDFLLQNELEIPNIKAVIEQIDELPTLRKQIDKRKLNFFAIMQRYSDTIQKLIATTQILGKKVFDEEFLRYSLTFHTLLEFAEVSGKERAFIAYFIHNKKQRDKLLPAITKLEIEYKALQRLLQKNMPYQIAILFKKRIPFDLKREFEDFKSSVMNKKKLPAQVDWWGIATKYIDALFSIEYSVLQKIIFFQMKLKEQALYSLIRSAMVWLLIIISFMIFLRLFNSFLEKISVYYNMMSKDRSLYSIFSEFSENVLHIKNFQTLVNLFAVYLDKTSLFNFLYITDCKGEEIFAVEKIAISYINDKLKELLKDTIQEVSQKRQYKIFSVKCKELRLHKVKVLALFPIVVRKKCNFILVIATKQPLSMRVIDFIMRMIDIFEASLWQLDFQQKQQEMQENLALLSHTFDSHEAIVLTDKNGNIVKVNKAFEDITGYKEEEVIGKKPSILKSGKHPKEFYEKMWRDIKEKGHWKGEIYNRKKDGTIYPQILSITAIRNEEGEITNYVSHFFDISDLKKIQEENEKRAMYDLLTEIFNRGKLIEELELIQQTAKKEQFLNAFLFIDLDNFKYINDSYGHTIGDKVLIEVSQRLKRMKKEGDILARISGDEFAFVMVDVGKDLHTASSKAAIMAQKLLDIYDKPVVIDDIEIDISFSIGIYIFPMNEKTPEDIITNADIAMYHSKKSGKRSFSFYDEKLDIEFKQFLIMKKEIEKGLKNREFKVFYQPKIAVSTGEVIGFEALVRWESRAYGLLYPDKFFPYIRGTKLIYDMTLLIVDNVLRDLELMQHYKDIEISINISTEQFNNKRFMEELYNKFIDKKGSAIILEIVEDALIRDTEYATQQMKRFQEIGIRIAIDDFGTGYSSLGYLRELPVNEIKIDKGFILHLFENKNDVIVQKIIEIAKIFGYKVTAEGVESERVVQFLRNVGCDYFQGFYFSRAISLEGALKFLQ